MQRLFSVSVDLDEIPNYFRIHGLSIPNSPALVYECGLARFETWAAKHGLALTLFAVGADAREPSHARWLRSMAQQGHEIANHSLDHRYDFSRLGWQAQREQVLQSQRLLEEATGCRVRGFRAPGYVVTDQVYRVLRELGVDYSSSVFPCVSYYGLKALALGWQRLRGRASHSVLDRPQVLRAPSTPYQVGTPYWTRGDGVWELPIAVTRGLRLPFIGTALTMAGPVGARLLTQMMVGRPFVNLELHGIDLLDVSDHGLLATLAAHQPDLRIPWGRKQQTLDAALEVLRQHGYRSARLDQVYQSLAGDSGPNSAEP